MYYFLYCTISDLIVQEPGENRAVAPEIKFISNNHHPYDPAIVNRLIRNNDRQNNFAT